MAASSNRTAWSALLLLLATALAAVAQDIYQPATAPLPQGALARIQASPMAHCGPLGFLPDGRTIVAGGQDRQHVGWGADTARIQHACWDVATGRKLLPIPASKLPRLAHEGPFSVRMYDRDTWEVRDTAAAKKCLTVRRDDFGIPAEARLSVRASHDGSWVLLCWDDVHVIILAPRTGKEHLRLRARKGHAFLDVDITADACRLATLEMLVEGKELRVCIRAANGGVLHEQLLGSGGSGLAQLRFHANGQHCSIVHNGQRLMAVCSAATGRPLRQQRLTGEWGADTWYETGPDGRHVIWVQEQRYEVWDIWACERIYQGKLEPLHGDLRSNFLLAPDGAVLAVHEGYRMRLFDLRTGKERFPGHPTPVEALAFAPDGKTLATVSFAAPVHLWDIASGALVRCFAPTRANDRPRGRLGCGLRASEQLDVRFAEQGTRLVGAWSGSGSWVWETATGKMLHTIAEEEKFSGVSLMRDGRGYLRADGSDFLVRDPLTGRVLWKQVGKDTTGSAAFTPDGKSVLSMAAEVTEQGYGLQLCLYPMHASLPVRKLPISVQVGKQEEEKLRRLSRLLQPTDCRIVVSDDQRYAAIGVEKDVRIFDLRSGKVACAWEDERYIAASTMRFTRDGHELVVCYQANKLLVWNVAEDRKRLLDLGPDFLPGALTFSADGARLAIASIDGSVLICDWQQLRAQARPLPAPAAEEQP